MSLHKLTAGSGYSYLTRQVAAQDATDKGGVGLASYYTARGETPGEWIGSGLAGIEGLAAGDVVTPAQMQSLFGSGHHPLAAEREAALEKVRTQRAQDRVQARVRAQRETPTAGGFSTGRSRLAEPITETERREARRLGTPFRVYDNDVSPFRVELAKRLEGVNEAAGLPRDWPVPADDRARIRTEVAHEFFRAEHGRDAADARELAATIAKHTRSKTTAVAGFDLTFSPVKSVSTLWAIAEPSVAAKIELAHQAAVTDALQFIEKNALFTRTGTNGVRQVDVTGLVATAFTHRDSRAGDPDLHTHVAVANKTQALGRDGTPGRWLAIDGRVLYKAAVAASETYNTALEKHLGDSLGLRFEPRVDSPSMTPSPRTTTGAPRHGTEARKRPVREIVGVDPALNTKWSARRASIEARRSVLATEFQATHSRPPSPVEALQLAQQATLETRDAKHEPRSLAEQRTTWRTQAVQLFGGGVRGEARLTEMIQTALSPSSIRMAGHAEPRPGPRPGPSPDAVWFDAAASRIINELETRRSTWQTFLVHAEAQRQVRSADLSGLSVEQVDGLVRLLTDEVLDTRSVSLARPSETITNGAITHPIVEPNKLRRRDGSSVYTVAGSDLHTSQRVLAAEQRIVAAAGRRDGHQVEDRCVDLALLGSAANGTTLNAGQAALVRQMATSGARVQLAVAPAGSGKTTAMNALTGAWLEGGGSVLGLAPSAAAAAQLGEAITATRTPARADGRFSIQPTAHRSADPATAGDSVSGSRAAGGTRAQSETLAKLTHSIANQAHSPLPAWVEAIGPNTLVVIDEAGMADTLSLDQAIDFVLKRGGSVRLVGDDQQLAAIGAGGVLRDITATHGALQLSELMRFADPAEGAASLALREGDTSAIGFYLDRDRVHVGDLATMTDQVFAAWQTDRVSGLDSIMLAPTRDLVSELNHRARAARLAGLFDSPTGRVSQSSRTPETSQVDVPEALLSDGNRASVGDLVITRTNDRRLRISASDWVKNGDRWTVLEVHAEARIGNRGDGHSATQGPVDLSVQHNQTGRIVRLPAAYVAESVELGYATTIHTAQGVSADSMHGLAGQGGGELSRQLLYTMLTRGRRANHIYLPTVGDGDPHSVIKPEMILPRTATDLLERMLARDEAPASASSLLREQNDPAVRLGDAATRYLDSLYVAAEDVAGPTVVSELDQVADEVAPGLSEEAAWPALRAHLLLLAAAGDDPVVRLRAAVGEGELDTARDVAAILDWRLDDSGLRSTSPTGPGPLPWLPPVPAALRDHPQWRDYLAARSELVVHLAEQVHTQALGHGGTPSDPAIAPAGETGTNRIVARNASRPSTPVWARNGLLPDPEVIADVEVWRAATKVDRADRRPTGPPVLQKAQARYQRSLNRRIAGDSTPAMREWGPLLSEVLNGPSPHITDDDFAPQLAERLAAISRAGIDAAQLVRQVASPSTDTGNPRGPLPDDHAAAALWWRIAGRLSPAVAAQLDQDDGNSLTASWAPRLIDLVGADRAERIQTSTWWPTLVTVVDHALQRGWRVEDLLAQTTRATPSATATITAARRPAASDPLAGSLEGLDECQAMVWRASIALDPVPDLDDADAAGVPDPMGSGTPPADLWEGYHPELPEYGYFVDTPGMSPAPQDRDEPEPEWHEQLPEEAALPIHASTDAEGVALAAAPAMGPAGEYADVFRRLRHAALAREADRIPLAPSPAEENRAYEHEVHQAASPVPAARMLEVNAMAQDYFEQHLPASWGQQHLHERFGVDMAAPSQLRDLFRPGQAPAGWTGLVQHLRRLGVTDEELLTTGLATTASTGRLIDRFRDRVMFPITDPRANGAAHILGFVGRRHPDLSDVDPATGQRNIKAGPKYLNTADTPLFHKGAQLYAGVYGTTNGTGGIGKLLNGGAVPVVVEGPMDAIAVTLSSMLTAGPSDTWYVGVSPLGTSLTDEQASQLASVHHRSNVVPIVATDPDVAGRVAAERTFWMLTPHGLNLDYVRLPLNSDPADLLSRRGPAALAAALAAAGPLVDELLDERLDHLDRAGLLDAPLDQDPRCGQTIRGELAKVVAASSPEHWIDHVARIAERLNLSEDQLRHDLLDAVDAWTEDPRKPARQALTGIHHVRERLEVTEAQPAAARWAPLGSSLDPRLPHEPDWAATAMIFQDAHDQGHNVAAAARQLVAEQPLNGLPAQDLRYRLVTFLDLEVPDLDDVNPHLDPNPGTSSYGPATLVQVSQETNVTPSQARARERHPSSERHPSTGLGPQSGPQR